MRSIESLCYASENLGVWGRAPSRNAKTIILAIWSMMVLETNYDESVEISQKFYDVNLEKSYDNNSGINSYW